MIGAGLPPASPFFGFATRIFGRLVGPILLGLTACHYFGPDGLRATRPRYNEAINASMNEQFVQNLVRLRYRDPTYFLDVASVAATLKLNLSGGLNQSSVGFSGTTGNDILKFNAGAEY